jgi:hypothetical protein
MDIDLADVDDDIIGDLLVPETVEPACPSIAGWQEDDFAIWVSAHPDEVKAAVCDQADMFDDVGFCEITEIDSVEILDSAEGRV